MNYLGIKTLFIILASIFCLDNIYGQNRILKAYIVKNQKDTISGTIRYKDWENRFRSIDFKADNAQDFEVLSVEEITLFYVFEKNETFISKKINYNLYYQRIIKGESPINKKVEEVAFLKQIGKVENTAFYYLFDVENKQRFYIEKGDTFSELIYYTYEEQATSDNSTNYRKEVLSYKGQLKFFLSDCKSINDNDFGRYSQDFFEKLFIQYSNCKIESNKITTILKEKLDWYAIGNFGFVRINATNLGIVSAFTWHLGIRINLPRKFKNRYTILEIGNVFGYNNDRYTGVSDRIEANLWCGTYFFNTKIQPFLQIGGSTNPQHVIMIGTGLGINKLVNLELRSNIIGAEGSSFSRLFIIGNVAIPIVKSK